MAQFTDLGSSLCNSQPMGLGQLGSEDLCWKLKNRWLFEIISPQVSGEIPALPPQKAARPNLIFKEHVAQHISETIYYPSKPEFKPINLTLYDVQHSTSPVLSWLEKLYNPSDGTWTPPSQNGYITTATLKMLSGCGDTLEQWVYENVWAQAVDFGELDMGNSEVITIDLIIRYARAYIL